jgi:phage-related protein
MKLFINDFNFVKGTSSSATASARFRITYSGGSIIATITLTIAYDGENTVTLAYSTANVPSAITILHETYKQPRYYGNSTKVVAPSPMYIDLDIGEAYGLASGEIVSYNDSVRLPSDLPKLSSGANTITFDDTITTLKIVPRWWKV